MQRCPSCGNELPDNARFCSKCGETLQPHEDIATISTATLPHAHSENEAEERELPISEVPTATLSDPASKNFAQDAQNTAEPSAAELPVPQPVQTLEPSEAKP